MWGEQAAAGIAFLIHDTRAVWGICAVIGGGAILAYWFWFRRAAVALQVALDSLAQCLASSEGGWGAAKERARNIAKGHEGVRSAWLETEERAMALPHGQHTVPVMIGAPRDIWTPARLLTRRINLPLAEAVPNLLVGIGLLFTFLFLTLALNEATSALAPQVGKDAGDLTQATRGLLGAAGAKFLTSLTGLFASIVWTMCARQRIAELSRAAEDVLERLARLVPTAGAEMAVFAQIQSARELQLATGGHIEVTRELAGKAETHVELTEELLNEARDQTGTLKRFETDLAVSLAGAITSAFSPQMEMMTSRLVTAIDSLSDRIGTMNQEALQRMMEEFSGMLRNATDSEMTQLRRTLETLSDRLTAAGQSIGEGAGTAAERLDKAGTELLSRVGEVSANLSASAASLDGATQRVGESMSQLGATISHASELGREGAAVVKSSLETANQVFDRLNTASANLQTVGISLERVSGEVANAIDSVEEMTQEQRAVVTAVRDATPQALASVQRVLDLLQQTVLSTEATMAQTRESMAATSKTLGTTVAEITTGVSEYSKMVSDLHRKMDEQMATAVGQLHTGVSELEGAIEELGEQIQASLVGN